MFHELVEAAKFIVTVGKKDFLRSYYYSDGHDPDYYLLSFGAEAYYQGDGCGVD